MALLPPLAIQKEANQIKHHFAEVYNSKAALKSPPHITLQPPFYWEITRLGELKKVLEELAQHQAFILIILDGFAAFKPRVIYINVLKTPELLSLQKELMLQLESSLNIVHKVAKHRPFTPHITVGFKDLTKANFYQAWEEFKERPFDSQFNASKLTLFQHNGKKWEIDPEFCF